MVAVRLPGVKDGFETPPPTVIWANHRTTLQSGQTTTLPGQTTTLQSAPTRVELPNIV